jgi:hypothetical protein
VLRRFGPGGGRADDRPGQHVERIAERRGVPVGDPDPDHGHDHEREFGDHVDPGVGVDPVLRNPALREVSLDLGRE